MAYVPRIDEAACAAHGDCVAIAPEVFELDDVARVIGSGPPELIMEAAEACPSVAISVFDEDSGEQVYP
ncbi:MAG: ferredoxin [Solirubrobacterales bacterium]